MTQLILPRQRGEDQSKFFYDPNLVLYLPLYELDGASFMSRDHYGHLCTVTGALWTPRGRLFDGVNDLIDWGNNTTLNFSTGDFSISIWEKRAGVWADFKQILSKFAGAEGYTINTSGNNLYFRAKGLADAGITDFTTYMSAVAVEVWTQVCWVVKRVGTTLTLSTYQDGIFIGAQAETIDGSLANATDFRLLTNPDTATVVMIGEVMANNRALFPAEILHNYQATKWRFR